MLDLLLPFFSVNLQFKYIKVFQIVKYVKACECVDVKMEVYIVIKTF